MVTAGELAAISALVRELRAVRRALGELTLAVDGLAVVIEADLADDERPPADVLRLVPVDERRDT